MINTIISTKRIQVQSSAQPYRIFGEPAAGFGVIPAHAEID